MGSIAAMDDLEKLLTWTETLDRHTAFGALVRLQAIAPSGWIEISPQVNDVEQPPLTVTLKLVEAQCAAPSQRQGLCLALEAWFEIIFAEGSTSALTAAPRSFRLASESAPLTDEQMADVAAMHAMFGASTDHRWSKAVRSWKDFKHAFRGK